jgi:hypothetical protein
MIVLQQQSCVWRRSEILIWWVCREVAFITLQNYIKIHFIIIMQTYCIEFWYYINRLISFLVVNVTLTDLDPLVVILHFLNQHWIAARLVCSVCEAVARTAVMSAKVAVVYSRYNNGPRALPWGALALTEESSVYSVSAFTRKCVLCR